MDMNRSVHSRETQDQATWAILILGIILNDRASGYRFPNFLNADVSQDSLVNCVLRKLEKICCNLGANRFDQRHLLDDSPRSAEVQQGEIHKVKVKPLIYIEFVRVLPLAYEPDLPVAGEVEFKPLIEQLV